MILHKGRVLWMLVMTLSALVAGCAPLGSGGDSAAGTEIDLDGTAWTVIEMNGEATPSEPEATLDFAEGQVSGIAFVFDSDTRTIRNLTLLDPLGARPIADEDEILLDLEEGRNHLMIKVEQWKAGWGLAFRLKDVEVRNHKQKYYIQ